MFTKLTGLLLVSCRCGPDRDRDRVTTVSSRTGRATPDGTDDAGRRFSFSVSHVVAALAVIMKTEPRDPAAEASSASAQVRIKQEPRFFR